MLQQITKIVQKRRKVSVNVTNNISGFLALSKCIYLWGGQHSHVKLYVYFKLDYKFGRECRRILFVVYCKTMQNNAKQA